MKKIFILFLLNPIWIMAQNIQVIETVSGEDIAKKISSQMQYLLPEFTDGIVTFSNQPKATGKLNYNLLIGEMHFMDNNQQVLALSDRTNVLMIAIGNRKFYPYKGNEFAEELQSADNCSLRVRYQATVAQQGSKGAYGTTSTTTSSKSYSSINSDGIQYNLPAEGSVLVSVNRMYYLAGKNGKYTLIINTKTFTKQFPKYKLQIETFVKQNSIRFNNDKDLKALFTYCIQLNNE